MGTGFMKIIVATALSLCLVGPSFGCSLLFDGEEMAVDAGEGDDARRPGGDASPAEADASPAEIDAAPDADVLTLDCNPNMTVVEPVVEGEITEVMYTDDEGHGNVGIRLEGPTTTLECQNAIPEGGGPFTWRINVTPAETGLHTAIFTKDFGGADVAGCQFIVQPLP